MTKYITDDERRLFHDAVDSSEAWAEAPARISDEEKRLFRDTMSDVTKSKTQIDTPAKEQSETIKIRRIQIKEQSTQNTQESPFNFTHHQPSITGSDILSYSKPGLQHKKFSQLKQGKMRVEATLDLHEHTVDQAISATELFLQRCHQLNFKNVCIIHGKGNYSGDNKPILKNLLNNYLRQHPLVIAFHSAKNHQGGTGAVMVIIKSSS